MFTKYFHHLINWIPWSDTKRPFSNFLQIKIKINRSLQFPGNKEKDEKTTMRWIKVLAMIPKYAGA
jgi:hypothetical protein